MSMLRRKQAEYVLALGGGGARGLAHIGVLKVLQKEGVRIGAITGTSMGAVIGAMFAYYADATEVEEVFRKFLKSSFHEKYARTFFLLSEDPNALKEPEKTAARLGRRFLYLKAASTHAVFSRNILGEAFRQLVPDVTFSSLRIPFACVAADLRSGVEVILSEGKVIPAIVASSSIPGFVEPASVAGHVLIDGSTTSTVPVSAARQLYRGRLLAVDVSMELRRTERLETAFEIAMRSGEITGYYLTQRQLLAADFVIHPQVGRTTWSNFDKLDEMIKAGETAAKRFIPKLRRRN